MICTCGICTFLYLTPQNFFTETLSGQRLHCLKPALYELGNSCGKSNSCFPWPLVFGTGFTWNTETSSKLGSVARMNTRLLSSGSACGAAGAQHGHGAITMQLGRMRSYIREHLILCNASRANSPGQSDPRQGEKKSEICVATAKRSILSLSLSLLPLLPLCLPSVSQDPVARGEGRQEHKEGLGRWRSLRRSWWRIWTKRDFGPDERMVMRSGSEGTWSAGQPGESVPGAGSWPGGISCPVTPHWFCFFIFCFQSLSWKFFSI